MLCFGPGLLWLHLWLGSVVTSIVTLRRDHFLSSSFFFFCTCIFISCLLKPKDHYFWCSLSLARVKGQRDQGQGQSERIKSIRKMGELKIQAAIFGLYWQKTLSHCCCCCCFRFDSESLFDKRQTIVRSSLKAPSFLFSVSSSHPTSSGWSLARKLSFILKLNACLGYVHTYTRPWRVFALS